MLCEYSPNDSWVSIVGLALTGPSLHPRVGIIQPFDVGLATSTTNFMAACAAEGVLLWQRIWLLMRAEPWRSSVRN